MDDSIVTADKALRIVAELASVAAETPDIDDVLRRAVELAIEIVPGCEQAGISVLWDGRIDTPVSVGDLAQRCDQIQERILDGPCIEALLEADTFRIDDIRTDDRWPEFAVQAQTAGLGSMLACRLASTSDRLAAVNLYSTQLKAFDDISESFAIAYATHVGLALGAAERERNLHAALQSRELIGQAIGILMERHRLAARQAFDIMVEVSQRTHVKLRLIAEELVRTGALPDVTD